MPLLVSYLTEIFSTLPKFGMLGMTDCRIFLGLIFPATCMGSFCCCEVSLCTR